MTDPDLSWTEALDRFVAERTGTLVDIRRHLHRNPEPSGREIETTRFLSRQMADQGLEPWIGAGGCGLTVESPGPAPRGRLALRGDMDALCIHDAKGCAYRSRVPGVMHACGHDAHSSCIAVGAMVLEAMRRESALPWPVPWKAIFQPAEEKAVGAMSMIRQGVLEGVRAILSLHLDPTRPVGGIGWRDGPFTAACDEFSIRITGKGGHGSRPQDSRDALLAAATLITGIYQHLPRRTDPLMPVVATIGSVTAGENANSIPATARLRGMIRTTRESLRHQCRETLIRLVSAMESLTDCRHELEFPAGCPGVINAPGLNRLLRRAAATLPEEVQVEEIPEPSIGGEDFGEYTLLIPGCMFRLGCRTESGSGLLHSPYFDLDERCLPLGVRLLVRMLILEARPE